MKIEIVDNQRQWDDWINDNSDLNQFSQSWEWGDISITEGKRVERLSIIDNNQQIAQMQVIYFNLPLGWKYAFCPKGPIKSNKLEVESKKLIDILILYFKNQGCIFFRLEPAYFNKIVNSKKVIDINPRATILLDLGKPEDELLKLMKSKTRYNIRLAQKKNLRVIKEKDLESFWDLSKQTGLRDKFSLHPKEHYKKILDSESSLQYSIMYKDKIIVSSVFIGFGNTFTYLYGASDYGSRKLMAPYLLQWEGIKTAKELGYKYYDFFGIAPRSLKHKNIKILKQTDKHDYEHDHQYAGVTRFKMGFGGEVHEDPGTFDVVLNKNKYIIYNFLRKINRLIR